jgi:hypothetical protein
VILTVASRHENQVFSVLFDLLISLLNISVVLALLLGAAPARAQDAFEIQVYDAETAEPGHAGFELHLNASSARVSHYTLEPHVGLLPWLEAGAYFQTFLDESGRFHYGGVKLRGKVRVPRRLAGVVGLALNVEVAALPRGVEESRVGFELRPIVDLRWRRLYVSVNPIVGLGVEGPEAGHPSLEPCATITVFIIEALNVGLEYYSALGAVDNIAPARDQVHRLFGVFNVDYRNITLNFGVGYGFAAGDRVIGKAIVGLAL